MRRLAGGRRDVPIAVRAWQVARRSSLVLALAVMFAGPSAARAAVTISVDRTDDPDPTASACTAAANDCSLRGAVAAAAVSGDTIALGGTQYNLARGEIGVDKSVTISGQGANQTTISAGDASRIFKIGSTAPGVTVAISDLKLTGGQAPHGIDGLSEEGGPGRASERSHAGDRSLDAVG